MSRHGLLAGAALLLTLPLSGCLLLETSASAETLTIYASRPEAVTQGVVERFEEAHPQYEGKVQVLTIGAQEIPERVRAETHNPQADVWWGGTSQQFSQGVDAGLLTEAPRAAVDQVPERYRGAGGLWLAEMRIAQVLVYNPEMVDEQEAPQDWDDLVEPRYRDQLLIRDVASSGTMRSNYAAMVGRFYDQQGDAGPGYDWLRELDANTKEYTANPTDLYLRIERQEAPYTVWALQDILLQSELGKPLEPVVPESGAPLLLDGVGKVEGGPNGEAADAFISFLFSDESQQRLAEESFQLSTVPLPEEPEWQQELDLEEMPVDWDTVDRQENEWITYWSENIKGRN